MRDSTNATEYDLTDKNISNGNSDHSEVRQIKVETANEFSTNYYQKINGLIKPEELLMNVILPTVSNRLKYHFESRKLRGLSPENNTLTEKG